MKTPPSTGPIGTYAEFGYTGTMELEIAVSAAGFSLCLLVCLVLLSSVCRCDRVTATTAADPPWWLGLVFLETTAFYAAGLSASLDFPEPVSGLLSAFDGSYGLPALYLFVRESLGAPARRPSLHFLPAVLVGSLALVALLLGPWAFDLLEAFSWLVESAQFMVYGSIMLRLLLEPRREGPRLRQARRLALGLLASYLLLFGWVWLDSSRAYFQALSEGGLSAKTVPGVIEFLLVLPCVLFAGYVLLARPWLLFGELMLLPPRESSPPSIPGPAAALRKYARTRLAAGQGTRILDRARTLLNGMEDLSAESLTPRSLAAALGLPYHVLSRVANEVGSGGVPGLIANARLDRAERLLAEQPGFSVLDVAFEAGFAAKSSFNEAFKRRHGVGPREWRESARSGPGSG